MHARAINLAGKTSLGSLAALLKKSRLLICNDTGTSHIAAGLKVPSVIITTGSDPYRWAPLNEELHTTLYHEVECRPCSFNFCPYEQQCAYGVEVGDVIAEAKRHLGYEKGMAQVKEAA
jgi:ADP-heptose:LPS heptosyltransferase